MAVVHMQGKRIMPEEGKRQKQSERERERGNGKKLKCDQRKNYIRREQANIEKEWRNVKKRRTG